MRVIHKSPPHYITQENRTESETQFAHFDLSHTQQIRRYIHAYITYQKKHKLSSSFWFHYACNHDSWSHNPRMLFLSIL